MRRSLLSVLDHYGIQIQTEKFREELAELSLALCRFVSSKEVEAINPVIEEIADVENLIEQFKYAFRIQDEVEDIRISKMQREINRIENGPKNS